MQAVILAGGKGTRMQGLGKITPKILLPVDDKTLLDYLLGYLKKNGVDNIIICTGYLGNKIKKHIKEKDFEITITISQETKPLGTAGSIQLVKDILENEFFVLYGDIYTTISLEKMLQFHKRKKGSATLALHTSDHPQDSTVVKIDKNKRIHSFKEKPGDNWKKYGNLTNIALYILKKDVLNFIPKDKETDFAKDVFPKMLRKNKRMFGYATKEYSKDIGTLSRYIKVKQMFQG